MHINQSVQNKCKTVIKWQECAAEGVVLVGGPELYGRTLNKDVGVWINDINELLPITRKLIDDSVLRANITKKAKNHLRENGWIGPYQTLWHRWLLEALWKKRHRLDCYSKERLGNEQERGEKTWSGS